MASKHSVDDSVIERRLRPIYDWLDNGNNKRAVQEADKVLRKQPNLQCACVLKALALLRLGKNEECYELIQPIVSKGTNDDATLQALTICYREMHQPHLICSIYEKAAKLDPVNEDIISHLFMSYVRVGDYKKQQQTAFQLYKLKPKKNPYYFWAVMSIVMQSHILKDSTEQKMSLQLAEKMVQKFINEDKIDSETEVLTYLYILEIQEKYKEALEVLGGPLSKKITQQPQNFLSLKKASYNSHMKEYETASSIYRNLILLEPDNWQHYVHYVESVLAMWEEYAESPEGKEDPLITASQFLNETRNKCLINAGFNRSPLLGLLQLALKLRDKKMGEKTESLCGNVTEQLFVYIKLFGDKMCCYGDIVNFLPLIPKEEICSFLGNIKALVKMDEQHLPVPVDVKNTHQHQIWLQLRRSLGQQESLTPHEQLQAADELVAFYEKTDPISTQMVATDIKPNDAYLILAAHCYFDALSHLVSAALESNATDKQVATEAATNVLIKLCSVLEYGINLSKANFQLKLLLIKAYNMIGATEASYSVYERLDLKQIQMDTLGHVLALQAVDSGSYSLAANIFSSTLKFFMANYKDTSDPLIMSYKFGSLIRIPEFVEFRERLNNSLHFATITAEQMMMDLTTGAHSRSDLSTTLKQLDIDPSRDKTNWDNLRDNRDLAVMNTWEPEHRRLQPHTKQETFNDEVFQLRLKNTTLRIVSACFRLRKPLPKTTINDHKKNAMVNGDSNGPCDTSSTVLKELIDLLQTQVEDCDKYRIAKPPQIPLQGPDTPRIYSFAKGHHLQFFLHHAQMFYTVYECTEGSQGMDSWSGDVLKPLLELCEQLLSFHLCQLEAFQVHSSTALPGPNAQPIAHLSHLAQMISMVMIVLDSCSSLLAPLRSNVAKKNKKKKGNIPLPEIIVHFNNYITTLNIKLQKLEDALSDKVNSIKDVDSYTDGTSQGSNPAATQGSNPSSNQGANPSTNQGFNHNANQGANPSANQGSNPSANQGLNPSLISNLDLDLVRNSVHKSFLFSLTHILEVLKAKRKLLCSLQI